jgi:HAMP domain-containing protein
MLQLLALAQCSLVPSFRSVSPQAILRAGSLSAQQAIATLPAPVAAGAAFAMHPLPAAASFGEQDSLLSSMTRDPTDAYYLVVTVAALSFFAWKSFTQTIEDAKDYDRRGEMANKMAAEMRKNEVAARRQKVLEAEPLVYERMQQEAKDRANKRAGWKNFPGFKDVD